MQVEIISKLKKGTNTAEKRAKLYLKTVSVHQNMTISKANDITVC